MNLKMSHYPFIVSVIVVFAFAALVIDSLRRIFHLKHWKMNIGRVFEANII